MRLLIVAIYNLCLLAGAAYLIEIYGWSNWTMFVAILLMSSSSSQKTGTKDE